MGSITSWIRLEPRGRDDDMTDAVHARVYDPLWMLARQWQMGEFQGDKVLEQLQVRWPNLCVIVVTGYPTLENMRTTFKLKVFDYLTKPFSLNQLRQTLFNAAQAFGLVK